MESEEQRAGSRALRLAVVLSLAVGAAGVASRPLIPRDETRYVSVAWEMWRRGEWLVPHLNGEAYSHKPPMLFWVMNAGWAVLGVSEWWARMVGPLCGVVSLWLVWRLGRALWGAGRGEVIGGRAALMLTAAAGWMVFASLTMFDAALTACVLAALLGVVRAGEGRAVWGWGLAGAATGAGVLTKGPVVFVHVLPVMVLGPWWLAVRRGGAWSAWRWYAGVLSAVVVAVGIGLAWALPAARAGGEKFAEEILWGQTAGRAVSSFRHARGWWFYVPLVPAMLLPWSAWAEAWRAAGRIAGLRHDAGVRLLVSWVVPALVVFFLISGKQAHYLVPLGAGAALLLARGMGEVDGWRGRRGELGLIAAILMGAGVVVALLPVALGAWGWLYIKLGSPSWGADHHPWAALALVGCGLVLKWWDVRGGGHRVAAVACVVAGAFAAAQWDAMRSVGATLDTAPMGRFLREREREGRAIAHLGEYHGQYHFVGRLERAFDVIWDTRAAAWAREHPGGVVVGAYDRWPLGEGTSVGTPMFSWRIGQHMMVAWSSEQVLSGEAKLELRGRRTGLMRQEDEGDAE